MVGHEQVAPLAPVTAREDGDREITHLPTGKKILSQRKIVRCCGCCTAVILILVITIVILIFTVFRVKEPDIKMNNITITQLELINGTNLPKPGFNMSMIADVSVKNPNVASFKYGNTSTSLYYHGVIVGDARGPPGRAKSRRTSRMNVTVDIITDRVLASPNLSSDIGSGALTMTSYSKVGGRVNILNVVKKHVTVKMNCTITVNISTRAIQEQKCKKNVDI